MGWIICVVMLIVIMASGGKADPNAYLIAASLFAVAGAIGSGLYNIKAALEKKDEPLLKKDNE